MTGLARLQRRANWGRLVPYSAVMALRSSTACRLRGKGSGPKRCWNRLTAPMRPRRTCQSPSSNCVASDVYAIFKWGFEGCFHRFQSSTQRPAKQGELWVCDAFNLAISWFIGCNRGHSSVVLPEAKSPSKRLLSGPACVEAFAHLTPPPLRPILHTVQWQWSGISDQPGTLGSIHCRLGSVAEGSSPAQKGGGLL
ncbi:hypothetical protein NKDENANG_01844 [Candidatus Entotheonellaceae bacterium PAL068K]